MTLIPWNKGKKMSDEYRQKLSEAHKGLPGHPMTPDGLQKIKEARKRQIPPMLGKHQSDETKFKIGFAQVGVPRGLHMAESKAKMSSALKASWAKKSPLGQRKVGQGWITRDEYDVLFKAQNGVCAICGLPESHGRRLAADHDHDTGQIRGLLCQKCNTALGIFDDEPVMLERALQYLKKY